MVWNKMLLNSPLEYNISKDTRNSGGILIEQILQLVAYVAHVNSLGNVKVKLSLCFNWAPRHESVLGSGDIAPLILWLRH
jgi:hypothetical protein